MAIPLDALNQIGPTPPESPLEMPEQSLKAVPFCPSFKPLSKHELPEPRWDLAMTFLARVLTFGGAAGLTVYAAQQMVMIVSLAQITFFQWIMVAMLTITFAWIALAATGALAGVLFGQDKAKTRADSKAPLRGKTALLMPIYNEDAARSFAALAAMAEELAEHAQHFEIFVISDTNDPDVWIKETAAIYQLREDLQGKVPVWYRRRTHNAGKKVGNVSDFVARWGARYEYMLVLDADSILAGETIVRLVREMDADERCGILQTLPQLYGGQTLFARLQQYASYVYGGVVARGITAWQNHDGNYWGHNALIRLTAFAEAAGLPHLAGKKPFGGAILSHDFVEAAFIRRAGWSVKMMPNLGGSWEEGPPSIQDVAIRDRRWAQGNLQHLKIIGASGLKWPNRMHMLIGVMSYLASPLWLTLIAVGLITYLHAATASFNYFSEEFSLFPSWPIFDAQRMFELFVVTMIVLLLPKVVGYLSRACRLIVSRPWRIIPLSVGVLVETFFSLLFAPIFMCIHSKHIWDIFTGKDSGWNAQQRVANKVKWRVLVRQHTAHTLLGLAVATLLFNLSWPLLAWMAPTLVGLVLAIPLAAIAMNVPFARLLRRLRILLIPEEHKLPSVMVKQNQFELKYRQVNDSLDVVSVITNDELSLRHFRMLSAPLAHRKGQPDLVAVSAQLKIDDADTVEQAFSWLNKEEKLALLTRWDIACKFKALRRA